MKNKPRILFTTPVLKHPAIGGPYLRIENTIKALSQISELTIYSRTHVSDPEIEYFQQFCRNFYCDPSTRTPGRQVVGVKRFFNFLTKKIFDTEIFSEKNYSDLLGVADLIQADIIWLGYGNISYPALKYLKQNSEYKVVCDSDSIWSLFIFRGLPYVQNETEKIRIKKEGTEKEEEERWGTQMADVTTAVSEIDAEYYRKIAKTPDQIKIFSNVIDLKEYETTPPIPAFLKKPCLFLAGTFWRGSPMEESARWTIEKILPLVKMKVPAIHFYIVGNGSDKILADIHDPSITITGQLPSVLPFLFYSDVAVVPLKFESGTRFKILEAGACNIPVVSTSLGAEGIPVTHGVNILIADDPEFFADEIIKIILDYEYGKTIGSNLHMLIKEKYDLNRLIEEGTIIIDYLLEGRPSR
jgi:polysaccharide biosynthesis protein PslH